MGVYRHGSEKGQTKGRRDRVPRGSTDDIQPYDTNV